MSHAIPPDTQRLADRLHHMADEIESAARYGVPIPYMVSASGHEHGFVSFSASLEEFDAWAEYTEADVTEYDHEGGHWWRAVANVNGLPVTFAASTPVVAEVTS
jgi:hypothetical protein